jgi:BMFP domain-containing protein YqiC
MRTAQEAMMQTRSPIFDDLADIMTSAAGAAAGAGEEIKSIFRAQADRFIADMDLVSREEFETLKAMTQKLHDDNQALRAEIDALKKAGKKTAAPKTRARKTKT